MNWKAILALTVLAAPLAWCEAESKKADAEIQKTCISAGREWSNSWGGYCRPHEVGQ